MFENHFFTRKPEELSSFKSWLLPQSKIVITFHQNPDGDAFGSSLGLRFFLENSGYKNVTLISPTDYADYIAWMPGVPDILVHGKHETEQVIAEADIIFCLDFSSTSRLKEMKEAVLASKAKIVVMDHHEEPEDFGNLYYWNVKASSTCELVYQMIEDLNGTQNIDINAAICIYTGLLTDTGSFRFDSTTSRVHEIAGKLIDKGVSPSYVHRSLFDNNSFEKFKFLGYIYSQKLIHLPEYRVAYIALSEEELKQFNSKNGDTEGLANVALSIENVAMAVLFTEKEGQIRISFRSIHDMSVADLARNHFDGGGHKNAAGGRSSLSLEETVEKFLNLLPEIKNELLRQRK